MINVTMIKSHGLAVSFQANTWEEAYEKIKDEAHIAETRQPIVTAYASESEWNESKGGYRVVKAEYFFRRKHHLGLYSAGYDTDIQLDRGKLIRVR
jgi:hypothetical protein